MRAELETKHLGGVVVELLHRVHEQTEVSDRRNVQRQWHRRERDGEEQLKHFNL